MGVAVFKISRTTRTIQSAISRFGVVANSRSWLPPAGTRLGAVPPRSPRTPRAVNWIIQIIINIYMCIVCIIQAYTYYLTNFFKTVIGWLKCVFFLIFVQCKLEIMKNTFAMNSLMQIWVLQSCDVVSVPGQAAPPYWGVGFVQVRVLDWVPPPQVTEHVP